MTMRYRIVLAAIALPVCAAAQSTLQEFRVDASHSTVEFSIPFLGHTVRGRFDDVKGTIVYAPTPTGGVGGSAVSVAIATASISSGSKHRDEHLRSDDFFDAVKFPVILFQSTGFAVRDIRFGASEQVTLPNVKPPARKATAPLLP